MTSRMIVAAKDFRENIREIVWSLFRSDTFPIVSKRAISIFSAALSRLNFSPSKTAALKSFSSEFCNFSLFSENICNSWSCLSRLQSVFIMPSNSSSKLLLCCTRSCRSALSEKFSVRNISQSALALIISPSNCRTMSCCKLSENLTQYDDFKIWSRSCIKFEHFC